MEFYTYLHCRPDGAPFYVGKGCDKWYRRSHSFYGRSKYHKNIVSKYGKENIKVYVFPCNSEAQALSDEIQQIAQLRREGYELCNLTNGGEGASGQITSNETRIKHAETAKKTWTGRKHTPETKEKMSTSRLGKKQSVEHTEAIRTGHFGKVASEETKIKLSIIAKSRVFSEETRKKMSESQKMRHMKKMEWLVAEATTNGVTPVFKNAASPREYGQ